MKPPDWLTVGNVIKPQGLRGEVRVKPVTDFPDRRFAPKSVLTLFHSNLASSLEVTVVSSRSHKGIYVIKFRNFDSVEQVEPLRGAELAIPAEQAHELEEHAYYFHEIIGCDVFTTTGENIGTIKEILQPGANDVWVVKREQGQKDLYLPYIADVVKQVLPEQKRVTIEWMEGLE